MRSPPASTVCLTEPRAPAIIGASVIGGAHVRAGLPCQDALRTRVAGSAFVLTVADGLGSAPRSHIGAAAATEAAAVRAMELAEPDPVRAAMEGMIAAREAVEALGSQETLEIDDLACTLMVAVATDRVAIAHIGDGAVVGVWDDEPYVLSPPATSEYLNETEPLTSGNWADNVRTVCSLDGLDGLALFTDGCQHAAVRRHNGSLEAHAGFFGPLFSFVRSGVSAEDATLALAELLGGPKMGEHSDDDKTLVLAVLR